MGLFSNHRTELLGVFPHQHIDKGLQRTPIADVAALVDERDVTCVQVNDELDRVPVEEPDNTRHHHALVVREPLGRNAHGDLAESESRIRFFRDGLGEREVFAGLTNRTDEHEAGGGTVGDVVEWCHAPIVTHPSEVVKGEGDANGFSFLFTK